jgi:hypothetical protein
MGPIQSFTRSIDYTIEFQNVGISYANKVVVVDSIDPRMPLKAIRMTGTSHPDDYQLIVRNNVLIWVFEGIYLPDSGTDLHGSKGFISFQAELKEELPFGQKVRNKAYIYFDYEYPVITNTVELYRAQDTIDPPGDPIDLPELYIFPNPARLSIEVYSNSARDQYVEIIDMNGKVVDGFIIEAETKKQIPVLQLSNGVYYLRTEEGRVGRFIKY